MLTRIFSRDALVHPVDADAPLRTVSAPSVASPRVSGEGFVEVDLGTPIAHRQRSAPPDIPYALRPHYHVSALRALNGCQNVRELLRRMAEPAMAAALRDATVLGFANRALGNVGVAQLCELLRKSCRGLRYLDLSGNRLGDAGVAALAMLPPLQTLNLQFNDLTSHSEEALLQLKHVARIDVRHNPLVSPMRLMQMHAATEQKVSTGFNPRERTRR